MLYLYQAEGEHWSSTEAELVAMDDVVSKVLWTHRFIEAQGFEVKANIVYRDNTSTMKLEENGRASASKRIRHFHIKYFYITDLIERGQVKIEYCPTDAMLADYMTKPVVGTNKFITLRSQVMNTKRADISVQQECVVHPSVVEPPSVKGGEHHQLLHYA